MTLSAAELAGMRATVNAFLPDTAVISRPTYVPDGMGSATTTWATASTVACRVSPFAAGDSHDGEQEGVPQVSGDSTWIVVVPYGTDVRIDDRVAVGGRTYEVVHLDGTRSWGLDNHLKVRRVL